jgi:hypothetical protein
MQVSWLALTASCRSPRLERLVAKATENRLLYSEPRHRSLILFSVRVSGAPADPESEKRERFPAIDARPNLIQGRGASCLHEGDAASTAQYREVVF